MRRTLSLLIFTTFSGQIVLGASAESNFWNERRRQLGDHAAQTKPVQLAALPSQAILNQLPASALSLSAIARPAERPLRGIAPAGPVAALAESIPLQQANLGETYSPKDASTPPVVIVQDIHLNHEAQLNISAVLTSLAGARVDVVGVEGAFEKFDFTRFLAFPERKVTAEVARGFIDRDLIAAPAYVALTSPSAPHFVGVDAAAPYAANVTAYLQASEAKAAAQARLENERRTMAEEKKNIFSASLRDFDGLREAYHANGISLGVYVERLSRWSDATDLEIDQFLEAYAMERGLDFAKVDVERRRVIEALARKLSSEELSALVARTVAYRAGRVGFGDYYRELKALCAGHGIVLAATPVFDAYVRYVLLSDGIRPDRLFVSLARLERGVVEKLATTPAQRQLADRSERLSLALRLVDFSLTPDEWTRYQELKAAAADQGLAPFEAFYARADERSHAMVDALLKQPTSGARAIVVGGFHTPMIARLLREKKIPTLIVSPRITKVDLAAGSAYLSIFTREKASLNQLFEGQALFLSPVMVAGVGTNAAPARERSDFLEGTLAAREPGTPGYSLKPGDDGFVRVRNKSGGLDVEVNPARYERRASLRGLPTNSLFDRAARLIAGPRLAAYRIYTALVAPGVETPVFGAVLLLMKPVAATILNASPTVAALLGPTGGLAAAIIPGLVALALAAAILTVFHAALNRDVRSASLRGWFFGAVVVSAPFLMPSLFWAAGLSFVIHAAWNSAVVFGPRRGWAMPSFLRFPLSLLGFRSPGLSEEAEQLLGARRGLAFTDDPDALDAQLVAQARSDGRPYLRVVLRNQSDLDRLTRRVKAEGGKLVPSEGPLGEMIKGGGILFIDYRQSDPKLVEGFNSLFDPVPYYGDDRASDQLYVVGAVDVANLKTYPVSFYSRFKYITTLRARMEDPLTLVRDGSAADEVEVEVFESPDIRQALIGRHMLDEQGRVQFEPGALVREAEAARRESRAMRPIVIKGARWSEPAVADLVRQIIVKGEVEANGETIKLPADMRILRRDGAYAGRPVENKRLLLARPGAASTETTWVINRENIDSLFQRTEVTADRKLVQRPGLLDQPRVRLVVSDVLPDWVWHRLMHSAADITVEVVAGVPVPEAYRGLRPESLKAARFTADVRTWDAMSGRKAFLVESSDRGFVVARARAEFGGQPLVLSVTAETNLNSLISTTKIDTVAGDRVFESERQTLMQALRAGRTVIIDAAESNPSFLRQLETALYDQPYLMENNERVGLASLPGRLVVVARPSPETFDVGGTRARVEPSDADMASSLAAEFPGRFNERDFQRILELRNIFSTIPASPRPGVYPSEVNFRFDRLRLLYGFNNWLEAFENVFIADYADAPEVAAFMRVAVRMTLAQDEPGRREGTIAAVKLDRALEKMVPSLPAEASTWQLADSLSLDLLQAHAPELKFGSAPMDILNRVVGPALVRDATGERQAYFRDRFFVKRGAEVGAAAIDHGTRVGETSWQEMTEKAVRLMKRFNMVFLKGSPGTGKSKLAGDLAAELGFTDAERVNLTAGADITEADVLGRAYFDGQRTRREDEDPDAGPEAAPIARWRKMPRGLLVIDEANLTDPYFWNMIADKVGPTHQVIFTGNQDTLAGRQIQDLLRERVVTLPFAEFGDDFIKARIDEYLSNNKNDRPALRDAIFNLTELFRKMGRDQVFSLRDVQELVARVNVFLPSDALSGVALVAWQQYQGTFSPEERLALRHLIHEKFGVDVELAEQEAARALIAAKGAAFAANRVALVPSAARTVLGIVDFLRLRTARIAGDTRLQGKRGVIYEGPSGRGKDVLLIAALRDQGFMDAKDLRDGDAASDAARREKRVYSHVNASLDYDKMVKTIREAQDKGFIVIVSEMNLLPSAILEGKLNDVLTGKADVGFGFFATINSESFGGREKLSTALQNRVVYQKESDYSEAELREIAMAHAQWGGAKAGAQTALVEAVVKTHVWIRDQIADERYHPTTRDLLAAVTRALALGSADDAVKMVYGPLFLTHVLGRGAPTAAELTGERPRVDNIGMLNRIGTALLTAGGKPFRLNIDASDPTQAGGYHSESDNSVTMRSEAFKTSHWLDTFWHEISHGLFTRDFPGLVPTETDALDPVYQDLEDLRHLNAFTFFFPESRANRPTENEIRLATIANALDDRDLVAWMRQRERPLTARHLFQYALTTYAKERVTREQLEGLAELIDGLFEVNPLTVALRHLDGAVAIRNAIPKTLNENDIRFQQHRALVLMNAMRDDYSAIPEDDQPPPPEVAAGKQESAKADAVEFLKQIDLRPVPVLAEDPSAAAPTRVASGDEIRQKRQALAAQRRDVMDTARRAVTATLSTMERDVRSGSGLGLSELSEILSRLELLGHADGVAGKVAQINDAALTARRDRLVELVKLRMAAVLDGALVTPATPERPAFWQSVGTGVLILASPVIFSVLWLARRAGLERLGQLIDRWVTAVPTMPTGAMEARGRYTASLAHSRKSASRKNPKPLQEQAPTSQIRRWVGHLGQRHTQMADVSHTFKNDINMALADFVARKLVAQRVYGREGTLDIERFLIDPVNGFVRSGGREERVKKKIVVMYDDAIPGEFDEILNFLGDAGFDVSYTVGTIPADRAETLLRGGLTELITRSELQRRVEAVYAYGLARLIMDEEKQSQVLTVDQQLREAERLLEDLEVSVGRGDGIVAPIPGEGFSLSVPRTRLTDLSELRRMKGLVALDISETPVADLTPLGVNNRNLHRLVMNGTPVRDLSALLLIPDLAMVRLDFNTVGRGAIDEILRQHPNKAHLRFWDGAQSIGIENVPPLDPNNLPPRELTAEEEAEILSRPNAVYPGVTLAGALLFTPGHSIHVDFRSIPKEDLAPLARFRFITGFYMNDSSDLTPADTMALAAMSNLDFVQFDHGGPTEPTLDLIKNHPNRDAMSLHFGTRRMTSANLVENEIPLTDQMSMASEILAEAGVLPEELEQHLKVVPGGFTLILPSVVDDISALSNLTRLVELDAQGYSDHDFTPLLALPRLRSVKSRSPVADEGGLSQAAARHPNPNLGIYTEDASGQGYVWEIDELANPLQPGQIPASDPGTTVQTQRDIATALLRAAGTPVDLADKAVTARADGFSVNLTGGELQDLTGFALLDQMRALALNTVPVSDLSPLLRNANLALLTLTRTRVTRDEVHYLLSLHPNHNLVVVHNGVVLRRSDLPSVFLNKRGVIRTDPRLSVRDQVDVAVELLAESGLTGQPLQDEKDRLLRANYFSLEFDRMPNNVAALGRLEDLSMLTLPELPADLTSIDEMSNLLVLNITRRLPSEDIFSLLFTHPNPRLQVINNGITYTSEDIPALFHPRKPPAFVLETSAPFNGQLEAVQKFSERAGYAEPLPIGYFDMVFPTAGDVETGFTLDSVVVQGADTPILVVPGTGKVIIRKIPENTDSLSGLEGVLGLVGISVAHSDVEDLTPLGPIGNLRDFDGSDTAITNIRALENKPLLRSIKLARTGVADISPLLNNVGLRYVDLLGTQVYDISPLAGIAIQTLVVPGQITLAQIRSLVAAHPDPASLHVIWKKQVLSGKNLVVPTAPVLAAPSFEVTLAVLRRFIQSFVDKDGAMAQVRRRFAEEGRQDEFADLERRMAVADQEEAAALAASGGARTGISIVGTGPNGSIDALLGQVPDMQAVASRIVTLALVANNLPDQQRAAGQLLGELLVDAGSSDLHIRDLANPSDGPNFADLAGNPDLDLDALAVAIKRETGRRAQGQHISEAKVNDALVEMARVGVGKNGLQPIFDAALDDVKQVVMIVRGPEDQEKMKDVEKALKGRSRIVFVSAGEVTGQDGRVSLNAVDGQAMRATGNGLRGSLLILPDGTTYNADVPEDMLRAMMIATLNDMLAGSLLRGPSLLNIHRIARLVAMSA